MVGLAVWLVGAMVTDVVGSEDRPVIRFGVRVLLASAADSPPGSPVPAPDPEADEQLRRILPRLRALFRYSVYRTLAHHGVEAPLEVEQRFVIPGGCWLKVTPELVRHNAVQMSVQFLKGAEVEMQSRILSAPGAPAIFGGYPYGDGVLIIILWANPAPLALAPAPR